MQKKWTEHRGFNIVAMSLKVIRYSFLYCFPKNDKAQKVAISPSELDSAQRRPEHR